jgi:enamine deaminase RidA (YjgF/YER057c/UK114 family)
MTLTHIRPGARLSGGVIHGNAVHLSGLVPENPEGKDIAVQTQSVLSRIDAHLAEAGTDKTKIISATIWLSSMADFAGMNTVWDAWVAPGPAPARATVEAKLARPDFLVEIQVTAALS